jgi:hypothetical protein
MITLIINWAAPPAMLQRMLGTVPPELFNWAKMPQPMQR